MPSLTGFNLSFTPSRRMSLLTLLFIVLFLRLGFWQLERADEKKQLLLAQSELAKSKPIAWQSSSDFPVQYQQFTVQGYFLPDVFLFDNQHYQHQFGYDVLSPFVLADGRVILVDRGWVTGDMMRQTLPVIQTPRGFIRVSGSAYYPSDKNWLLGQAFEKKADGLVVVELIDTTLVSQFLHKSVYPFIMRLGKDGSHGFVREWAIVSMPPERHYGYALQWFAIVLVILILFIALNLKKKI